jgi:transcriptional regulator with XRE-family HTH domain
MHLSDFMSSKGLSDEAVAEAIGRSRVSVSRYRRRRVRPDWGAIEAIKSFTQGAVLADDWLGPLTVNGRSTERCRA